MQIHDHMYSLTNRPCPCHMVGIVPVTLSLNVFSNQLDLAILLCFNPLFHVDAFHHVFENITENVAFGLLEQMLHFPYYFHNLNFS